MKKNLTELVFILDRSGSMNGLEADTIGGFNSMIAKQKGMPGEAYVSTVLFNESRVVVHDRAPLTRIAPMTGNDYQPMGCTALLDAVGRAIHHIGNVHKYAREEDRPEKTVFIITTDGLENASREYTAEKVKQMIERQRSKYGWEFIFLGANIDAVETAARYGIARENAVNYNHDAIGTQLSYDAVSDAVAGVRACGCMPSAWKDKVEKDHKTRK